MSFNNFERIQKVNFAEMTDVSLARWLRELSRESGKSYELNLQQSLSIVKALRIVYKMGEIRGQTINRAPSKGA